MGVAAYKTLLDAPEELKFIVSDKEGREIGFVKEIESIDMDLGDTNDFELQINAETWSAEKYGWGNRLYIPGTEYGGLLEDQKVSTESNIITWYGYTWRGLLDQKLIYPPDSQANLTVSGEANNIIKSVIENRFGSFFTADTEDSGVQIKNFKFERYCTILKGLEKMLAENNARLRILYKRGMPGAAGGWIVIGAVPVTDWSEELECSQDGKLNFTTRDYRRGINHLVCAGEGEGTERSILHLYVQEDGTIGQNQYYMGLDEREALYSYTSVESDEKLLEEGTKRLKDLMNYKQLDSTISDVDIDIGDIVGGRDRITGMTLQKPVINKILKIQDGTVTVEYKLKGEV